MKKEKSAFLLAISVSMYIFAAVILLAADNIYDKDELGIVIAALICIPPTAILVYRSQFLAKSNSDLKYDEELLEVRPKYFRTIAALLWIACAFVYMIISSLTEAWSVTWIIFFITLGLHNIIYHSLSRVKS
ncbi:hypothetical protein R2R35_08755 [Anaerocolumna sp. AGMB13020]|uniref:hypothetical protein n=1 Tax=Anaerocolumna sp. AGMB13020 TaxID=3081750 RepID=UPI002954E6D9|nr:hypothetical protein [Anaerocolumna sp. AGMB13020]WOO38578.1 hypothetical protein R2R35_08755 [Anaerocolumna sp. AGMB13020]